MKIPLLSPKSPFKNPIILLSVLFTGLASFAYPISGCAGEGSSQVVCNPGTAPINLRDLISGETDGGIWSMTAYGFGGVFDEISGTYTPDASTNGIFHFYYSFDGSECGAVSSKVTLTFVSGDTNDAAHDYSCQGDVATFNLNAQISNTIAGSQPGGVWVRTEGTGGNFDAVTGIFECTADATSSAFQYTVQSACGTHSCQYNVFRAGRPVPGAGNDGQVSVCEGTSTVINLYDVITDEQLFNPMWTRISGEGGEFDADTGTFNVTPGTTTSVFRYRMASGAGMCGNDISFATVNIDACVSETGCSVQYWKENPEQWCGTVASTTTFGSVFTSAPNSLKNKTISQVLQLKGAGPNNLARQAVAAMLNICNPSINYPVSGSLGQLKSSVNNAFQSPSLINNIAQQLQSFNELDCPLSTEARIAENSITAYPMPFREQFSVKFKFEQTTEIKIEIFNSIGRLVMTKDIVFDPQNIGDLMLTPEFAVQPGALYIVKATSVHGSSVQKIVAAQ